MISDRFCYSCPPPTDQKSLTLNPSSCIAAVVAWGCKWWQLKWPQNPPKSHPVMSPKMFRQNVPFKGENERWAHPIISSSENDSIIVTNLESYPLLHFWIPLSKRISQQKGPPRGVRAWKSQDDFGIKVSRSEKADLFNGHLLQCYAIIIYVQLQVNIPVQFPNSYKRIASVL